MGSAIGVTLTRPKKEYVMALKRFVSRDLFKVFNDETKFVDTVAKYLESKAMSKKEAEKTIVDYYQKRADLLVQLDRWING